MMIIIMILSSNLDTWFSLNGSKSKVGLINVIKGIRDLIMLLSSNFDCVVRLSTPIHQNFEFDPLLLQIYTMCKNLSSRSLLLSSLSLISLVTLIRPKLIREIDYPHWSKFWFCSISTDYTMCQNLRPKALSDLLFS